MIDFLLEVELVEELKVFEQAVDRLTRMGLTMESGPVSVIWGSIARMRKLLKEVAKTAD